MSATNVFSGALQFTNTSATTSVIGSVTQTTNRTTAVTINNLIGFITTFTTAIGTGVNAVFTVNCSAATASSRILLNVVSSATPLTAVQNAVVGVQNKVAGAFDINVGSVGSGDLGAITIAYQVIG